MAGSTDTPYGFKLIGTTHGGDAMMKRYYVDGETSTAIFKGDVMSIDADTTVGERVVVAGATIAAQYSIGVCIGTYNSDKVPIQYLASATAGYIDVCVDPYALYQAQVDDYRTGSTGLAETYCNNNTDHVIGAGSTLTGMSGHTLDASTPSTSAARFRITGLVDREGNAWGDRYVELTCMFNEHSWKTTTGAGT